MPTEPTTHAGAGRDAPRPAHCCLYRPGHHVHWIQLNRAGSDGLHRPEEGRIVSTGSDGLVVIEVDGGERRLWNHDPDRLAAIVSVNGPTVRHQPRWSLLRSPSPTGRSVSCICVTDYLDPDRVPCVGEVAGDTAVDRILTAGGATLSPDELRAAVAELGGPSAKAERRFGTAPTAVEWSDAGGGSAHDPGSFRRSPRGTP